MKKVLLEKKDGIGIITLNEPEKMNGLSEELVGELLDIVNLVEKDDALKIMIITGQGKIFSAGGDISIFNRGLAGGYKYIDFVLNAFASLEKTRKPVISAVNGYALGGGTELTLASDIVIASEKAVFGLPEVGIGIMPGYAVIRLHEIVGRTRAKELIMSGRQFDVKEAERIGIVNQIVPKDQLMAEAEKKARLLMEKAPLSLTLAKNIVNRAIGGEDIAASVHATSMFFGTEDIKEGQASFFEKRKPDFKGK